MQSDCNNRIWEPVWLGLELELISFGKASCWLQGGYWRSMGLVNAEAYPVEDKTWHGSGLLLHGEKWMAVVYV